MKLLCDHMLGSLARWLRFMGYDTAYPGPIGDSELIAMARSEDRILVTRDKELASRYNASVRIKSDELEHQIRELSSFVPLRLVDPLSRCSLCNAVLEAVPLEKVHDLVPEGVRSRHQEFWRCPNCGHVYWQGSHWDKMVERLNSLHLPAP